MTGFDLLGVSSHFGPFAWRGGLVLSSDSPAFGGFSGLALSKDGEKLLAVSDRGQWLSADLAYAKGDLAGIANAELAPLLDAKGRSPRLRWRADAEALCQWSAGQVMVGFEGDTRIAVYDLGKHGFKAPGKPIAIPKAIAKGPRNSQLEAIGRFAEGPWKDQVIAISEANLDAAGDIRAWVFSAKRVTAFTLKRHKDYAITDLAILGGGKVLTLERRYGGGSLPGVAIRRFDSRDIVEAGAMAPELLFEGRAPFYRIDNMEGMAVHEINGETRVTLISDDNFNRGVQQTILIQFAIEP